MKIWADIKKLTKQTSDRTYTIAIRVGQLMNELGPPSMRRFGILSPETIYKLKKADWDRLLDHAATILSPQNLLEEELLTSQELSRQGENNLSEPEA